MSVCIPNTKIVMNKAKDKLDKEIEKAKKNKEFHRLYSLLKRMKKLRPILILR